MWPNPLKIASTQIEKLKNSQMHRRNTSLSNNDKEYFNSHKAELEYIKEYTKRKKIKLKFKDFSDKKILHKDSQLFKIEEQLNSIFAVNTSEEINFTLNNIDGNPMSLVKRGNYVYNKSGEVLFSADDYGKYKESGFDIKHLGGLLENVGRSTIENKSESLLENLRKTDAEKARSSKLSRLKCVRKSLSPPKAYPTSFNGDVMFVYLLGKDRANSPDIGRNSRNSLDSSYEDLKLTPIPLEKPKKQATKPSYRHRDNVNSNYSLIRSYNTHLSIEQRKDHLSFKQLRDFPKIKLAKLVKAPYKLTIK